MTTIKTSSYFIKWLKKLDKTASVIVLSRIKTVARGSIGLWKSVGEGVYELKIVFGPGYRIYFMKHGAEVIILLAGGEKKTQVRDIAKAKELAKLPIVDFDEFLGEE